MRAKSLVGARLARSVLGSVGVAAVLLALPAASGATTPGLNGRIAFNRLTRSNEGPGGLTSVWSMNPDGSAATALTAPGTSEGGAYSPDGTRLAFETEGGVSVAAADGSGAHQLVESHRQKHDSITWQQNYVTPENETIPWVKIEEESETIDERYEPTFTPDGSSLAVVHFTGTIVFRNYCSVTADEETACDGNYFHFAFDCPGCGTGIEAIDATTGAAGAALLPFADEVLVSDPEFSAAGALVYGSEPIPLERTASPERSIVMLPAPGATPAPVASGEAVFEPTFSPDGTRVAYVADSHHVGIVSTGGVPVGSFEAPKPLAGDGRWVVESPVFSPDGTLIAFADLGRPESSTGPYEDGGVYLAHPDGSGIVQVQGQAQRPTSWQALRPAAPPPVRARAQRGKKKLKLSRKGIAVVGKVVCGSSPCALKATESKLKLGKKRSGVKAILPKSLAAGASGQVKVKVKGKALASLKARHGGKLLLTVAVGEGGGAESLAFSPKLLPPAPKKMDKGRH